VLSAKPLASLISTEAEGAVREAIAVFSCKDKDVEHFLKSKACGFEKRDKSRTYLVVEQERYVAGEFVILGYFTLSLKALEFRDTLSKSKIKDIDGFSKEVGGVALVLIGQFGKDEMEAEEVSGKELLDICMSKVYEVHALIGGRYVLIECRDIDKVVDFYCGSGFDLLQSDRSDEYLQLVRRL
jgi:hypothetical protein